MPWNCFRQSLRRSRNCETFSAVAGKIMMLGRGHKKTWHGSSRHEASRDITPRHDTSHPQLGSDRMVNTGPGPGCHHASDLTIDLNHFLCWRLGWAGGGAGRHNTDTSLSLAQICISNVTFATFTQSLLGARVSACRRIGS